VHEATSRPGAGTSPTRVFAVNWASLGDGSDHAARLDGEVSVTQEFSPSPRRAQKLQQTIIELATETCKADLFDALQGVETEGVFREILRRRLTIVQAQRQFTAAALGQAADFFTAARCSSPRAERGAEMEVKTHPGATSCSPRRCPTPFGRRHLHDLGRCRKRYAEDCGTKFEQGQLPASRTCRASTWC
jgi:hypothetical protein